MSIDNPKCETCRWFKHRQDMENGNCLRYPPSWHVDGRSLCPETHIYHFCGEHSELVIQKHVDDLKKYFADKVAEPVKTPSSFPIGDLFFKNATDTSGPKFFDGALKAEASECQHEWHSMAGGGGEEWTQCIKCGGRRKASATTASKPNQNFSFGMPTCQHEWKPSGASPQNPRSHDTCVLCGVIKF